MDCALPRQRREKRVLRRSQFSEPGARLHRRSNIAFLLVAPDRLREPGRCFFRATGKEKHLGDVSENLALAVNVVSSIHEFDGLSR
jgi:hypothetical protein